MKENGDIRELYFSDEFWDFYTRQSDNVKNKFNYVFGIVRKEKVITTKFVKRLVNTEIYEMRVSRRNKRIQNSIVCCGPSQYITIHQGFGVECFF